MHTIKNLNNFAFYSFKHSFTLTNDSLTEGFRVNALTTYFDEKTLTFWDSFHCLIRSNTMKYFIFVKNVTRGMKNI